MLVNSSKKNYSPASLLPQLEMLRPIKSDMKPIEFRLKLGLGGTLLTGNKEDAER